MLQIQTRSVIDELIIIVKIQTTGLCSYCYGLNPFFQNQRRIQKIWTGGGEGANRLGALSHVVPASQKGAKVASGGRSQRPLAVGAPLDHRGGGGHGPLGPPVYPPLRTFCIVVAHFKTTVRSLILRNGFSQICVQKSGELQTPYCWLTTMGTNCASLGKCCSLNDHLEEGKVASLWAVSLT